MEFFEDEYQMAIETAVQKTVLAGRYVERLVGMNSNRRNYTPDYTVKGTLVVISDPDKSVVGGWGALFDSFISSGKIEGYKGHNQPPSNINDPNYNDADLCVISFEQTLPSHASHHGSGGECLNLSLLFVSQI